MMYGSPSTASGPGGERRRRLRAVLAADVANYSGLMSVDETNTVDALTVTRRIAREELDLHGGWLFGLPGDGIFALFESAVDAVKCALETQQRLLAMSRLSTMRLRIGVHLGEVVFQDGLPYGEALVIAARLESHAEPGGVLVSAAVMDAVAPRIAAQFYERGVFNLKHSPRRITTYSVSVDEPSRNLDLSSGTGELLDRTVLSVPATFGSAEPPASEQALSTGLIARQDPLPEVEVPSERTEPVSVNAPPDPLPDTASLSEPIEPVPAPARSDPVPETVFIPEPAVPVPAPARRDPVPEMGSPPAPAELVLAPAPPDPLPDAAFLTEPGMPVHAPVHQGPVTEMVSLPEPAAPVHTPVAPKPVPDTVSLPKATPLIVPSVSVEPELGSADGRPVGAFAPTAAEIVLSPHCAEEFIQVLTRHIGPVAGVLVRRLASRYADPLKFIDALADEIPAEEERLQFRMKARQVIGRQHS